MKIAVTLKEHSAQSNVRHIMEVLEGIKPKLQNSLSVLKSIQKPDEDHSYELFIKQLEILQTSLERTIDNVQRCLDFTKFSE